MPSSRRSKVEEASLSLISLCQRGPQCPLSQVQSLAAQFPDAVRFADARGWTCLHHGCAAGVSLEVVQALVQANSDVINVFSSMERCSVLHCAAGCPDTMPGVVQFLLLQGDGFLVRKLDVHGRAALHYACQGSRTAQSANTTRFPPIGIIRDLHKAWKEGIFLPDQQAQLPIHLAYLAGASSSNIRYLAYLDPASVAHPMPDGRLIAHSIAMDLMDSKKSTNQDVLEALIQADASTLHVPDPLSGKTLAQAAQQGSSFRNLDTLTWFRETVRKYDGHASGDSDAKRKMAADRKESTASAGSEKRSLAPQSSLGSHSTATKEEIADALVEACCQANASPEHVRSLIRSNPDAVRVRDAEDFLPLHWASCKNAPVEVLKILIEAWPDSVRETMKGGLPVHLACRQGASLDRIKFLVEKYPKGLEVATQQGLLPIHYVCRKTGALDVIKFLVDQTPLTLSETAADGLLPIHTACRYGKSLDFVKFLVERWPRCLQVSSSDGSLPIHYLCRGASFEHVQWMILNDPSVLQATNQEGSLPLHLLCANPKASLDVVELVYEGFQDALTKKDEAGMVPLDLVTEHNTSVADFIRERQPKKKPKPLGLYPLHRALSELHISVDVVRNILKQSPDEVCVPDEERMLPIHMACRNGASLEVIKELVNAWPESLKWTNKGGSLPLHTLCSNKGDPSVVLYLINAWREGTGVSNNYGWLPLHCACAHGASSEVIRLLVQNNEKSSRMATYGQADYPLHLACSGFASLEVICWLIEARQDGVRLANAAGELAIHKACFNSSPLAVVQFLAEQHPESIFSSNSQGLSPYDVAKMRRNHDIAEWLKSKEV
jgi:ankyrin repeat protein